MREDIERFLAEEAQRQNSVEGLTESIKISFQTEAMEKLEQYYIERTELMPRAFEKLEQVFKPWLQDFLGGGIYEGVNKYINDNHLGGVSISQSVMYPWLRMLFGTDKDEAFSSIAKGIAEAQINGRAFEAKRLGNVYLGYIRNEELWIAYLKIQGSPYYRSEYYGLRVRRWPPRTGNMFFSMGGSWDLEIPLTDINSANKLFEETHPEVILGFSEQIESGKIWATMEENLKNAIDRKKGIRPRNLVSRLVYDERMDQQRKEYLAKKGKYDWIPEGQARSTSY